MPQSRPNLITVTRLLALFLLSAPWLRPQDPATYTGTPPVELVQQWLQSGDSRQVAWAAHFITQDRHADLLPAAEEMLTPIPHRPSRPLDDRTTASLLDAVIQLKGTLPADTLKSFSDRFQTEELVLLARLPRNDAVETWQALYRPAETNQFRATRIAAQMLATNPPPHFAAHFLSAIVVSATINVHDPNSFGGIGGGGGSCCGAGVGRIKDDWPATPSYAFYDPPKPDPQTHQAIIPPSWTLFLDGPDPIYLQRFLGPHPTNACEGLHPLDDPLRSHLTAVLLQRPKDSPFPEHPLTVDLEFHDREAFRAQVAAFVASQQENFLRVAAELTTTGRMTEEERQAADLTIKLSLYDARKQPAPELPSVAFRPPVEWLSPPS